jgi:hypothetical protein
MLANAYKPRSTRPCTRQQLPASARRAARAILLPTPTACRPCPDAQMPTPFGHVGIGWVARTEVLLTPHRLPWFILVCASCPFGITIAEQLALPQLGVYLSVYGGNKWRFCDFFWGFVFEVRRLVLPLYLLYMTYIYIGLYIYIWRPFIYLFSVIYITEVGVVSRRPGVSRRPTLHGIHI